MMNFNLNWNIHRHHNKKNNSLLFFFINALIFGKIPDSLAMALALFFPSFFTRFWAHSMDEWSGGHLKWGNWALRPIGGNNNICNYY
jgi:hypothetical protein